uniref:Uncharacterized protein n=1 Tax=Zea mays TaxID=4577 RepID=A0A804MK80_MAIZE
MHAFLPRGSPSSSPPCTASSTTPTPPAAAAAALANCSLSRPPSRVACRSSFPGITTSSSTNRPSSRNDRKHTYGLPPRPMDGIGGGNVFGCLSSFTASSASLPSAVSVPLSAAAAASASASASPSLNMSSASTVLSEPSPSVQSSSDAEEPFLVQKLALLFTVATVVAGLGLSSASSDESSLLFSASAAMSSHDSVREGGSGVGGGDGDGGRRAPRSGCCFSWKWSSPKISVKDAVSMGLLLGWCTLRFHAESASSSVGFSGSGFSNSRLSPPSAAAIGAAITCLSLDNMHLGCTSEQMFHFSCACSVQNSDTTLPWQAVSWDLRDVPCHSVLLAYLQVCNCKRKELKDVQNSFEVCDCQELDSDVCISLN